MKVIVFAVCLVYWTMPWVISMFIENIVIGLTAIDKRRYKGHLDSLDIDIEINIDIAFFGDIGIDIDIAKATLKILVLILIRGCQKY